MTRKRKLGSVAALGGATAVIGLLTGLPGASADELSDLRANQQLLQQRIDQLAQAQAQAPIAPGRPYPGGPVNPAATTGATGGSFPRSFLIPGTDTSIRVGGEIREVLDYWLQNGQTNGSQNTTVGDNGQALSQPLDIHGQTVPGFPIAKSLTNSANAVPVNVNHSRGNGIFHESPRESKLNIETRTPTAYGEARTFMEFDWAGSNNFSSNQLTSVSDNLIPRLRYAYGTLGGFLAGQANSNASDSDANPETLDFGGDVGQSGVVRIPQIRYTYAGPYGSAFSVSLETPQTDVLTPAGKDTSDGNVGQNPVSNSVGGATINGCVANGITVGNTFTPTPATPTATSTCALSGNPALSKAPDITFASYWSQPWGHVDFRLIGRDLTWNDGKFVDRSFFGYGGGISGDIKPGWFGWGKDDIQWQFTVGNGIGRYLNESDDAGLATNYVTAPDCASPVAGCKLAATGIIVRPIFEAGASGGYQHWWLPNLRSNWTFGISHEAVPSQLVGPLESIVANKQVITAHVNLIWSPVAFIDTGIEYMWGQRLVLANIRGTEQALIGKFAVKF